MLTCWNIWHINKLSTEFGREKKMNLTEKIYSDFKSSDSYAVKRLLDFDEETQRKFDALLLYLKNRPEYPLLEYVISWHRTPKYFLTDVLRAVEFILQILLDNLNNEMSFEERQDIKNFWSSFVFSIWRKCE